MKRSGEYTTSVNGESYSTTPASTNDNNDEMLIETFLRATFLVESSPIEAVALLESVHRDVEALSLFSSNETLEDLSTKSLPFLAVGHFLAMALVNLPVGGGAGGTGMMNHNNSMLERKKNIHRSLLLWSLFLQKLEALELLSKDEMREYHDFMENVVVEDGMSASPPMMNRDAKIARFKAQKQAKKEVELLKALRERRQRCGIPAEEEMDGHDEDSLERSVALRQLAVYKDEALENWMQSKRELPMIEKMIVMEQERETNNRHQGTISHAQHDIRSNLPPLSGKPLQVTHITKDASGQLQIKRDEIRSKVFRPGWNQPTMTLEELGEREYQQALEREERQKIAESERTNQPKRYEDLVRDGMEDNAELVEASAKLDRKWDDWKDENPRGSGNKMANQGDKNF